MPRIDIRKSTSINSWRLGLYKSTKKAANRKKRVALDDGFDETLRNSTLSGKNGVDIKYSR